MKLVAEDERNKEAGAAGLLALLAAAMKLVAEDERNTTCHSESGRQIFSPQ